MEQESSSKEDYGQFLKHAKERILAWREQSNIGWKDIYTGGLTRPTVHRILAPEARRTREEWLTRLAKLFNRINSVYAVKFKTSHRSWESLFGDDFPHPPVSLDLTVSNYAEVGLAKMRTLTAPVIQFLESEFRTANDQQNVWKASQFLVHVCELYELTAEWARAAECAGKLAELNERTGDFHHVADALLRQGLALYYNRNAKEAKTKFERGLSVIAEYSSKVPPYRTQLRLSNYLALANNELGDSLLARQILESNSLPLAKDRCSRAAVASVENRLGVICLRLNDLRAAADYLISALGTRVQLSMRSEAARTMVTLGTVHERMGEPLQAAFIWHVSAGLQAALRDSEVLAKTFYELGCLYVRLQQAPLWYRGDELVVGLSANHFPEPKELCALEKICERERPQDLRIAKHRLLQLARREFEAAIYWDTDLDRKTIADLARLELERLDPTIPQRHPTPGSQIGSADLDSSVPNQRPSPRPVKNPPKKAAR
jgi:tetratricopeptide (TPR) repeat protein